MSSQNNVEFSTEPMWPVLINFQHLVSVHDVRRIHGDKLGCEIYVDAVCKNQIVKVSNRKWIHYSFYANSLAKRTQSD